MNIVNVRILSAGAWHILLSLLSVCWFFGAVFGAGDDFFLRQTIDVSGTILGTREADFNGDGMTDIVLLVGEIDGRRTMKSYIQRESGRFPPGPGQTIELSSSANMAQALDLDDDNRAELYVIDRSGLWRYRHDGTGFESQPEEMVSFPTLLSAGIQNGFLDPEIIHTISGRPVAFLPIDGGYSLWEYRQGSFSNAAILRFHHLLTGDDRPVKLFSGLSHNRQGWYRVNIPEVIIGDSNGDDLDDIYLIWQDRLAVFTQNERGEFGEDEPFMFQFQDPSEGNLCQASLYDYDRDGRFDIVCSRSMGGISGAETEIDFYHSTQIRRSDRAENYKISLTDACGNLIIGDFNHDGGPELVVPAIELGIMSTVKKMVTKKTDFHILIYPIDNLGRPAREPEVRQKISCRLDFESADPTNGIRINWSGDYDGDGLTDLVVADGNAQLVFYRGSTENYLESKSDLVLDMPNPDKIRPVHLNNDGRTDLIIIHREMEKTTRLTILVTNRIG